MNLGYGELAFLEADEIKMGGFQFVGFDTVVNKG